MVDIDRLRGKIVERRMNAEDVAIAVGINKSTFYRRLNGGGGTFTIEEADKIASLLALDADELNSIFFTQYVANTRHLPATPVLGTPDRAGA